MVRIAVCDKTMQDCIALENCLRRVLNPNIVIAKHTNAFSFESYIEDDIKGHLDVAFINLVLEDKRGIDIAQQVLKQYPHIKIIFMTETLTPVKDIFLIQPQYLLIKPYEQNYVTDAIIKTVKKLDEDKSQYLVLKAKYGRNGIISIRLSDIYYASSDKRKLEIYTDEEVYEINMKLNDLEVKLPNQFVRCHQSYIVNMDKIQMIHKDELVLYNDEVIPISRSRASLLNEKFNEYINVMQEE